MSKKTYAFGMTADNHFKKLTWASRPEISGDTYHGFEQVVDLMLKENLPLVIGGDFFDTPKPDSYSVDFAIKQIERLRKAGLATYWIDGNHDASTPSWCGIIGATSLHKQLTQIGGLQVYGVNYTPMHLLEEELKHVPADCDVLVMHQLLDLAMPMEGMWNFTHKHVPSHVKLVMLGDYHVTCNYKHNNTEYHYPGSTAMLSRSENPTKYCKLVGSTAGSSNIFVEPREIATRRYLAVNIELTSQLEDLEISCEQLEHNEEVTSQRMLDLFSGTTDKKPILDVIYNPDLENVLPRLTKAVKPLSVTLWTTPSTFKRTEESIAVPVTTKGAFKPEVVLAEIVDKDADAEALQLAQELLVDEEYTHVLDKWRTIMKV